MPKILNVNKKYRTYEWLFNEYIVNKKPSREIALIVGCDRKTIDQWLNKVNIPKRGFGGSRGIKSKEWLIEQYIKTVHRWMIKYNIHRRSLSKSQSGSKSHFWRGGGHESKSSKYVFVYDKSHPFARHNGYIYEHRIVVEKKIGKYLTKIEVIHHINFKRNDNRSENLYLFATHKEHMCYHSQYRNGKAKLLKSNI